MTRVERFFVGLMAFVTVVGVSGWVLALPREGPPDLPSPIALPSVPPPTATATSAAAAPSPTARSSDAAGLLELHNRLRASIGPSTVGTDPRIVAAAQSHAEYLAANDTIGHDEVEGRPGFTGATVAERLRAQGYLTSIASEVASGGVDAGSAVTYLWDLPYHRLGMMHPHLAAAGWGHAARDGRSVVVGVFVYDFARAASAFTRSPAAGQRDIPRSWDGREAPDPLPPGATRPTGWPIMIIAANAARLEVQDARLSRVRDGAPVALHFVAQIYEPDYAALIPQAPLDPLTTYRIRLTLDVGGQAVTEEWEFTTGR